MVVFLLLMVKVVIHASDSLCLSYVFHEPNFSTNLLSISRNTRDLNCCVIFFTSHCVFQDHSTKKMIGSGREENDLFCPMKLGGECVRKCTSFIEGEFS